MMDEKQLLESQKECAKMLGMTFKEYKQYLKNVKVSTASKSQQTQDNSFLQFLGLKETQLKLRKEV